MKKIILLTIALFSLLVSCNKSNNPIDTDNGLTLLYGVKARLESGEIAEPTVSTGELITTDNGVETKLKLSYNLEERYFHKETNDYKVFIYPENGVIHQLEEEGNSKTRKEFNFTSTSESEDIYRYLTLQQINKDLVDLTLMRINTSIKLINKGLAKDDVLTITSDKPSDFNLDLYIAATKQKHTFVVKDHLISSYHMESETKNISQVITFESDLAKPSKDEYTFITKTESETKDMLKDMVTKFDNNEIAEPKISTGNFKFNFNGKVFESSASYNADEHYLAMKSDLPGYTYDIKIYQDNLTLYELMNEESGKYYDVHQFPSLSILDEYYHLIASKYVLQGLIGLTLTDLERTISDFENDDIFLLEASSEKAGHLHVGYTVLSTNDLHFFEIEDYIIVDTISMHYEDGEYVVYNSFSNVKECEISKPDLTEYKDISLTKEKAFDLATSISDDIDNNNYVEPRKITVDSVITTDDPSNGSTEVKTLLAYDFDKYYFRIGGRSPFGEYKEVYIFEENYVLFELVEDINGVKTRTLHPCKDEVELESTYNVLLCKYAAFSMGDITKMFALDPFLEFKDKENALIHAYSKNERNLVVSAYDEATDTSLDFEIVDSVITYTKNKAMIQNGTIEAHYTVECDIIIPDAKEYDLV